jgi:hypothetical protein
VSTTNQSIAIDGLTLTKGKVTGKGGALYVAPGGTVSLSDVSVTSNAATDLGGGICVDTNNQTNPIPSSLTLIDSTINGNSSSTRGGGVYAWNVTVSQSQLTSNQSLSDGGALWANTVSITDSSVVGNVATGGGGGGIFGSTVSITHSTIDSNHTSAGAGGGVHADVVNVANCTMSKNYTTQKDAGGGALFISSWYPSRYNITSTITDSTFTDNYTTGGFAGGGAVWSLGRSSITGSTFSDNYTTGFYSRGGSVNTDVSSAGGVQGFVWISNSVVTGSYTLGTQSPGGALYHIYNLSNSLIANNYTRGYMSPGGGVWGASTIVGSVISGNTTYGDRSGGGGISGGFVQNSTISGNQTYGKLSSGGGINAGSLSNCTVTGNQTHGQFANGGGIYSGSGSRSVFATTIVGNTSSASGGGAWFVGGTTANSSYIEVTNSVIAKNVNAGNFPDMYITGFGNLYFSYSLVGNITSASFAEAPVGSPDRSGNLIGGPVHGAIDPMLGPLADNGGPTFLDGGRMLTLAPLTGSPVINAGSSYAAAGVGSTPASDERRAPFTRVFGGRIDMGAIEVEPAGFLAGDFNGNGIVDAADYTLWRDTNGTNVTAATGADGNGDGKVDALDDGVWTTNFGQTLPVLGAGSGAATAPAPADPLRGYPAVAPDVALQHVLAEPVAPDAQALAANVDSVQVSPLSLNNVNQFDAAPLIGRSTVTSPRDNALLLLLATQTDAGPLPSDSSSHSSADSVATDERHDNSLEAVDDVFASLAVSL